MEPKKEGDYKKTPEGNRFELVLGLPCPRTLYMVLLQSGTLRLVPSRSEPLLRLLFVYSVVKLLIIIRTSLAVMESPMVVNATKGSRGLSSE